MCFGDLQTSSEHVAANPEGDGGHGQGEDQTGHGSFRFDAVSLHAHDLMILQAVTVHPLAQAQGADDGSRQHGTARHTSEAIDTAAGGELHPSGAHDRIDGQAVNGAAVLTDAKHGVSVVDSVSIGAGDAGKGAACATPSIVLVV